MSECDIGLQTNLALANDKHRKKVFVENKDKIDCVR